MLLWGPGIISFSSHDDGAGVAPGLERDRHGTLSLEFAGKEALKYGRANPLAPAHAPIFEPAALM
jgi:hypothetical protein